MEDIIIEEQEEKDKKAHKQVFMACGEYADDVL